MIDFYLNLNNCVNATKIHCFDAKTSSVLYDYLSGTNQSITDINKHIDVIALNTILPWFIYIKKLLSIATFASVVALTKSKKLNLYINISI